MPFWDDGSNCLYLAGKGDGNIRYFEFENDKFEFLSEYKSGEPQRGIAFMPRRGINTHENEVMRAYKTVNDAYIEPIAFTVPRRAETFQADIFPPATGTKPAASAQEWFDGKTAVPNKIDLESVYDGTSPKEIASDYKAPPAPATVAEKPAPKKEEPKPAAPAIRSPPPTMNEQKGSISAMASRYQDKQEEEEDDDDASSFEEVSRPAQRQAVPAPKPTPAQSQTAPVSSTPAAAKPSTPVKTPTTPVSSGPAASSSTSRAAPSSSDSSLAEIKSLLEGQTKLISSQVQQISLLTSEVEALKRKVSSGSLDQSERIRQLELELEEARS
jgi:coronin-1B/1C/6